MSYRFDGVLDRLDDSVWIVIVSDAFLVLIFMGLFLAEVSVVSEHDRLRAFVSYRLCLDKLNFLLTKISQIEELGLFFLAWS
jgi:hypothetical protein